ncbi:TPA: hypothetical protein QDB40_001967 [Burkholderia vietnamiensis]|nr:hypothetical protein [Burkholderia vietnamiensis]
MVEYRSSVLFQASVAPADIVRRTASIAPRRGHRTGAPLRPHGRAWHRPRSFQAGSRICGPALARAADIAARTRTLPRIVHVPSFPWRRFDNG